MSYVRKKHDIGILDPTTSVNVGMMLAKREDRVTPVWEEHDGKFLAEQFFTGTPSEAYTDPESELILGQDSWRSGMGLEYFNDNELERYYTSIGCDLRHRGQAMLGWTPTAITLPAITAVSITNADFELDANWTDDPGGTAARDDTKALSGTYSWKLSTAEPSGAYQLLTWNDNHKGHTFKFICWTWASAATNARIAIDDGDTTTYSDYNTGGSGWEQLTVSKTIGSGATELRLELHGVAASDCWFDDAEIQQPVAGTIQAMKQFGANLYFGIGNELYKLNGAGNGFTSIAIFPTAIIALEVFQEHLYIGMDDGVVIEDCEDAWNESSDADVTSTLDTGDFKVGSGSAQFVAAAGIGVNTLWATEAISAVNVSSADGIDLWIKSSIAVSAGDLEIHMGATADCASPTETLAVPTLTAGKWTRIHIEFATLSTDTAIISIGLYQTTDIGVATVHIDNVELTYRYCYMSTGEVVTRSTIANAEAQFLQTVLGATPTLYLGHGPNEVRASTDPTNAGSWGGITYIDDASEDITELLEWQNLLYVMKEDKPFYIDSSDNVQDDVAPELESEHAETSGKNATIWHNKLYTQAGTQTLLEATTGGVNTFRSPANYITNDGNFVGRIFALSHDTFYLYAVTDNSDKVEVQAMRSEVINGVTEWVIHPIAEITMAGCETAYESTIFKKRLWISDRAKPALDFDGASGLVTVSDNAAIQDIFDSGGTIECWINADSDGEASAGHIIRKVWNIYGHSELAGKMKLIWQYPFSGDNGAWETTSTEVDINTWTHLVLTYDSSAIGNDPIFYVNGLVVALTESGTGPTGTRTTDAGSDLILGNQSGDNVTFDGTIDEVRLYTRILGQAEITTNYLAGRDNPEPFSTTSLAGYWKLDEGTGLTAADSSGNSNDGTITATVDWVSDPLYFLDLPATYGNIANDTNANFKTDGYFITPWLHANFKHSDKAWITVKVTLGHAHDTEVYWECHFQKLGDSSWTDAGDMIGTSSVRTATLFLTTWTPTSPMFRLKFVGKTDDTDLTPILLDYHVNAIMYPERKNTIFAQIRCANEITCKNGSMDKGKYTLIKNALDNARDATWPVTITDIDETTRYVKFLPLPRGTPRFVIVKDEKGRIQERVYNLIMQEVTLS